VGTKQRMKEELKIKNQKEEEMTIDFGKNGNAEN
jgi:hypothetical protein